MSQDRRSPIYALALGLAVLMTAPPAVQAAEPAGSTLWQSRWQYVRLVPRDGGMPNLHPSHAGKAEIRSALAQVKLDRGDGEPIEVLTGEERSFYADQLVKALDTAGPDQDVVISSIGMRRTILGLSEQKITTARVFVNGDGLNLIVGESLADAPNDTSTYTKPDSRLIFFIDGRRAAPAHPGAKWTLVADGTGVAIRRSDWAVVSAGAMAVPEPGSDDARKKAQSQLNEVQQQVQQMRQQMQAAPPLPPAVAPPAAAEDRLRGLDQLKAKGLITPREYGAKRKQILDSL